MKNKFIITILLSMLCTTSFAFAGVNNNVNTGVNARVNKGVNTKNINTNSMNATGMRTKNANMLYAYEGYEYQTEGELLNGTQDLSQDKPKKLNNIEKLFN